MAEYTNDMFGLQQLMRDEEADKEQAAINNAVNLAGTPRASMLANTINIAEGQGNAYANLGRMLTGKGAPVDPRVERMQRLEAIADQMPDPQTEQDYLKLAQMLRAADLPGEAQKAMEMVNSIRTAASTAASATFQDVNGATRYKETGLLVKGESATKTPEDGTQSLENQVYEANLQPYMVKAMEILKVENPKGLSGTELTQEARAMAQREYSTVTDAADLADNRTNFMKEFDFFANQKDGDGINLYTNAEAIAKATSLDRETVDESNQKIQDAAVLAAEQKMSTDQVLADDSLRTSSQMLGLLDKIDTNKWSQVAFGAAQWLGVKSEDVANKEMFFSMSIKKVMDYTSMTKGAISDAEMDLFIAAAPNLGKTTEGNRLLLKFAAEGAKAQLRVANHMRIWKASQKNANGTRKKISFNEWEIEQRRFKESPANAGEFALITASDDWKNLTRVGDSINTSTNLKNDLGNPDSAIGAYCAGIGKGSTTCINLARTFNI